MARWIVFVGTWFTLAVLLAATGSAQTFGVTASGHLEARVDDSPTGPAVANFATDVQVPAITMPPLGAQQATASGTADASSSGTAVLGRLSAVLNASSTGTSLAQGALAKGNLELSWFDTVRVTGPAGTLITLRVTATFTASVAATPSPTHPAACVPTSVTVSMSVYVEPTVFLERTDGVGPCSTRVGSTTQTATFEKFVGSEFAVWGFLDGVVEAFAGRVDVVGFVPSASAALDATGAVTFSLDVLTPGAGYTTASGFSYTTGSPSPVAPPVAALTVSATTFRSGETLTLGLAADNPAGQPEGDLYSGALLPDGRTVVFLSGSGAVGAAAVLTHPAGFVPMQVVPPGTRVSLPGFLRFTFPPGGLVPSGTYQVFVALVRRGVLLDDRIDPGDILAIDVKTLTLSP